MGVGKVKLDKTVIKTYQPKHRNLWAREVLAYKELPWACPKLINYNDCQLEIERCVPILELSPVESLKYRDDLWLLLENIHKAGWWHCDANLVNVVIHYTRGVLLIDWENLRKRTSDVSYDLYGAVAANAEVEYKPHRPDGVFWSSGTKTSAANYWKGL